jgi:hypothetical protein
VHVVPEVWVQRDESVVIGSPAANARRDSLGAPASGEQRHDSTGTGGTGPTGPTDSDDVGEVDLAAAGEQSRRRPSDRRASGPGSSRRGSHRSLLAEAGGTDLDGGAGLDELALGRVPGAVSTDVT